MQKCVNALMGDGHSPPFVSARFVRSQLIGTMFTSVPPPAADLPKFPRKLSETGLFTSTKDHNPAPGVIPYSVNAELWSDGAVKDRFMAIPGDAKIDYDAMTYPQPAPGALPPRRRRH